MIEQAAQRRRLGEFLRARREAMPPSPLTGPRRRRTPGLRREEMAQACGVSTTWYAWVEQGREMSLSAQALARLAGFLRLNPAERGYLFELAGKRDPAPPETEPLDAPCPADLLNLLRHVTTPAYLLDGVFTARGWNRAAETLFAPWYESGEPNLLRFVFLHDSARLFIADWEDRARRLAAEFRAETAHDTPERQALVAGLLASSPDFSRMWHNHAVLARGGGDRRFNHPRLGALRYSQSTLVPSAHRDFKLVVLHPA